MATSKSLDRYARIIRQGFALLEQEKGYKQINILRKLESLENGISAASLSNVLKNKKVGRDVLRKAGEGLLQIVRQELGFEFDDAQMAFDPNSVPADWTPYVVPEKEETAPPSPEEQAILHPDGRWPIGKKTAFLSSAQDEVIELGVRLNTFSNYFTGRNEQEFKMPVYRLLERNVNFKAYLLDPECNEAGLYFNDRGRVQPEELHSIEKIRSSLRNLSRILTEIETQQFPGKFEVYLYKHIPYNHFLIVDGERSHGRMAVSPYLYGVTRANCPVIELTKSYNRSLFRRYYQSFQDLTRDARRWEA